MGHRVGPKQTARLYGSICVSSLKGELVSVLHRIDIFYCLPVLREIMKKSKKVSGNYDMGFRPLLNYTLDIRNKI